MKNVEWLAIGALLINPVALAGEQNQYTGTWSVEMVTNKGETRKGTAILNLEDGVWDMEHHNVKKPCAGMRSPIVIKSASADELVFEIMKSKSLRGCEDYTATLKRVNETTLQGELNNGRKLTLVRE